MAVFDLVLSLLAPLAVLLHLVIAPYTKVEESFTLQATHDILRYGVPVHNASILYSHFDHMTFPGAVPRSFVGPLILAETSRGVSMVLGRWVNEQLIVRGTLGLFTALALIHYTNRIRRAYGPATSRFYTLLQLTQFHIPFYASRTLPNTFALIISLLAHAALLPSASPRAQRNGIKLGLYLLTIGGIIFRAELGLLLAYHCVFLLLSRRANIGTVLTACIAGGVVGLTATLAVDSFFWQTLDQSGNHKPIFETPVLTKHTGLIWPELSSFLFNFLSGKASEWGTSPAHYYFTSSLPKLLLNPISLVTIPIAMLSARRTAAAHLLPALWFIGTYSLLAHKEWRFIVYTIPELTLLSALGAGWIWNRRGKPDIITKSPVGYQVLSLGILASIPVAAAIATTMLAISAMNYPGGEAVSRVHQYLNTSSSMCSRTPQHITIHLDVPTCMTGATRFLQEAPISSPHPHHRHPSLSSFAPTKRARITWDKTESPSPNLLDPTWWSSQDYAIMSDPALTIGKYRVLEAVNAFDRVRFYRPGEEVRVGSGKGVKRGEGVVQGQVELGEDGGEAGGEAGRSEGGKWRWEDVAMRALQDGFGLRGLMGGWWIGVEMKEAVYILKREG